MPEAHYLGTRFGPSGPVWSTAGIRVDRLPVGDGDWFRAAGTAWQAVWPPKHLSPALRQALRDAVDTVRELADELESEGLPELKENLAAANEAWSAGNLEYQRPDDPADDVDTGAHGPQADESTFEGELDELTSSDPGTTIPDVEIPDLLKGTFREAARKVAKANNDLSLVFHDPNDGRLMVFGDIGGRALRTVLADGRLLSRYMVVLPPHHGTRSAPRGFPKSDVCIAQAGTRHLPKWHRHVTTHGQIRACVTPPSSAT